MLTSRKVLLSNLNYVHLQHVSLGVHLSMHPEVTDTPNNQDTGMKDGCYKWKDTTMVDPNSNDPSMPCQCCDQHLGQEASLQYNSLEDLDMIIRDECLSPDDIPLSPLSLSSPSTDSSSSSDFTLDDSPASMYYKEYSQDGLDTPDQQPDIIPLDAASEDQYSLGAINLSPEADTTLKSNPSETNNNMEADETPFIDWSSDSTLDSNTLIERSGSSSMESSTIPEPEVQTTSADHWPEEQDLLPGLPFIENTSTQTPKKTITSFHELALRRRSGGQLTSQPKRDRSDWLIVFSPDTEQPPINELTASVFYHGVMEPQTLPLPAGKEVTTFRELRYRNALNKQSVLQMKAHEERPNMTSTGATTEPLPMGEVLCAAWEPNDSQQHLQTKMKQEDGVMKDLNEQKQDSQCPKSPACRSGSQDAKIPSGRDHTQCGSVDTMHAIGNKDVRCEENPEKAAPTMAWIRGTADGGDRRGQEASNLWLLSPYSLMPPRSSGFVFPRHFGPAQLPDSPGFPPRMSPVGASPPHWALLPLLDTPDIAILLPPMFPRKRTFFRPARGRDAGSQPDPREPAAECDLLMADDSAPRQKKSLLIAVGSSVEKIISHFNSSRNQVQKAQLGDSRLSPVLGYLVLNHLCPSLYSLLSDGLKPYQKDVIIGRRRLSPWSLVEASTKTGPETVHHLFSKVSRLTQLRDPQRKFNAFIFGLLNMKQLDIWVLHLHQTYDQLSVFYLASGFLPLAATLQLELRDELLVSLQPLSALTFHTDLLFEHHHLSLQDLPTPHRVHSPGHVADNWAVPSLQNILDLGGWITHNLTGSAENKALSKRESLDSVGKKRSTNGPQPDMSALASEGAQYSSSVTKECVTASSPESTPAPSSNWWGHLSQASHIYLPSSRESLTFTTLRKLTSWSPTDKELNQRASSSKERDCPEPRLTEEISSRKAPQTSASGFEQQVEDNGLGAPYAAPLTQGISNGAGTEWVMDGSRGQHQNGKKGNWFGQLFGVSSSHGREMEARNSKSRLPSSWLPPNVNVWSLIRKQSTLENPDSFSHKEEEPRQRDDSRPQRSLRALCDHVALGEAQLSFKKGEVLQLLGTVDEDWIQCQRGNDSGLVPVGYTSLIL